MLCACNKEAQNLAKCREGQLEAKQVIPYALGKSCLISHLTEEIHHTREDDQQNTTTGSETEHLGQETLVQRAETFLSGDHAESWPGPAVLGYTTSNLRAVLYSALHHIHGGVENSSEGTTNSTGDQIVAHLNALVLGWVLGKESTDLEDTTEVTSVPEDVAPHGRFEALVERQGAFLADDFGNAIHHAVVLGSLGLVCAKR